MQYIYIHDDNDTIDYQNTLGDPIIRGYLNPRLDYDVVELDLSGLEAQIPYPHTIITVYIPPPS